MCSADPNNSDSLGIKANLYEHNNKAVTGADRYVANALCGPAVAQVGKAQVSEHGHIPRRNTLCLSLICLVLGS